MIRYYGNRVGRVTEGCAVVDPMFQNEALESFLRKQRNIQKIQWQDGIYDRLANSQQDMESAKGLKDVRIWQLRGDVDVHMKFLALFQMEQQYGSPKPDFYIKVYEGASDTNDLEELYDKFRYHPPSGYTGHGLSISDVLELYDETGSSFFYVDRYDFKRIDFTESQPAGSEPMHPPQSPDVLPSGESKSSREVRMGSLCLCPAGKHRMDTRISVFL